ncbi:MAG: bifunctional diaminohydroxyphosphoribosylaminopyrimidine deaminase/5-amino-6-(5-phosphoribosylamino)uracil reductase RibD [Gemmatimonadota bacterium]|nr:bifunctional diaminohydroxyphosphoribosylaminopyrimidine deaminase/5-amino-6-(5-phosphoribosylamino)uracil reductase RibD [Gemmatimonadota bacterium]
MSEQVRAATPEDGVFMRRALLLAARGWGQTAPNPMVGAVVVRDGVVVGEGWHSRYGAPHAEVEALQAAGEAARGATVYVTLEPCNHHGQTPPCTDALLAAGVSTVIVAVSDPHPVAQGGGARLREAGVAVRFGVEEDAARELNAAFLHDFRSTRPFVRLKVALSLDGALTDHTRERAWLTGDDARRQVHHLRAGSDGVAIGIGTARADDPSLTVRDADAPRTPPARIVFDTCARLPLSSRLVQTAREQRTVVVCWAPDPAHAAALEHAGVELVHAAALADALLALRDAGIRSLLVEGGAGLATSFLQDELVDRLIIFRAPLILGRDALGAFSGLPSSTIGTAPRWRVVEARRFGDDEMTVYAPQARGAGAI